mmetsp:Transcript_4334/g.19631  ORF Transcript_4334/g.19631 Transcript_4334/m.19631 type:complete len:247 (+) Transcript_4334:2481-3221(+)
MSAATFPSGSNCANPAEFESTATLSMPNARTHVSNAAATSAATCFSYGRVRVLSLSKTTALNPASLSATKSTPLMSRHSRWGTARSRPDPKTIPPKRDTPATLTDCSALPVDETASSSSSSASGPPPPPPPAASSGSGVRFGGTWICVTGPKIRRAHAAVHASSSSDGSGQSRMPVFSLARKFWTMTSCTCPRHFRSLSRMAKSASRRSSLVSPIPTSIPDVKGTSSSPARSRVRSRNAGRFDSHP